MSLPRVVTPVQPALASVGSAQRGFSRGLALGGDVLLNAVDTANRWLSHLLSNSSSGSRRERASEACCGTTPLPSNFNFAPYGISTLSTQPSGSPITHSEKATVRRGLPFLLGSTGRGAGRVRCSHRVMAGSYSPQTTGRNPLADDCGPCVSLGAAPPLTTRMHSVLAIVRFPGRGGILLPVTGLSVSFPLVNYPLIRTTL